MCPCILAATQGDGASVAPEAIAIASGATGQPTRRLPWVGSSTAWFKHCYLLVLLNRHKLRHHSYLAI